MDVTVLAGTAALLTLPEKNETISLESGSYHYEYETETRLEQERYTLEIPLRVMLWLMLIRISNEARFRRDSQKPRWKRAAYTSMRFFLGVFLFLNVTFRFVLIALCGRIKIKTAVSITITMDIYASFTDDMAMASANRMNAYISANFQPVWVKV